MLPVGLFGFMLPKILEMAIYADPPKNKLDQAAARQISRSKHTIVARAQAPKGHTA